MRRLSGYLKATYTADRDHVDLSIPFHPFLALLTLKKIELAFMFYIASKGIFIDQFAAGKSDNICNSLKILAFSRHRTVIRLPAYLTNTSFAA